MGRGWVCIHNGNSIVEAHSYEEFLDRINRIEEKCGFFDVCFVPGVAG